MTAAGRTGLLRRPTGTSGRRFWPPLWIRVFQAVLWLLVVSGPVAAGVLALEVSGLRSRVEVVSRQAVVELPADSAGAEGFAELFVAAFLSADEDAPRTLVASLEARSLRVMEQGWWSSARTVSLGAREVAPGYFAVTVAAEVLAKDPDSVEQASWVPAGTRFYTVGVVETDSGWAAVGLPTLVAAPLTSAPPDLLVRRVDGLREAPGLGEAVTRFLAAYLAGEGELARYTAPRSPLHAVQPPPFATVKVLEAGSVPTTDGARQVVALVQGTDEAGRTQVLQYAVVAAQRDGRWEVVELLPAPSLDPARNN
jgi:hypothetical protein